MKGYGMTGMQVRAKALECAVRITTPLSSGMSQELEGKITNRTLYLAKKFEKYIQGDMAMSIGKALKELKRNGFDL